MFIGEGKFESLLSKINQDILLEKRRGNYVTPSVIEQLEKYKEGNYYMSFSKNLGNGVKLGINPQNQYNTPTGIYSYPIGVLWDDIIGKDLPFAVRRPNIFVFRPKDESRVVYSSSYTHEQMREDYRKALHFRFGISLDSIEDRYINDAYKEFHENAYYRDLPNHPLTFIWTATRKLVGKNVNKWAALLYKLYDGIVDDSGLGIIHPSEPTQAVFFNSRAVKVVDLIKNSDDNWGGSLNTTIRTEEKLKQYIESNRKAEQLTLHLKDRIANIDNLAAHQLIVTGSTIGTFSPNCHTLVIQGSSRIDTLDLKNCQLLVINGIVTIGEFINVYNRLGQIFIRGGNIKIPGAMGLNISITNWAGNIEDLPYNNYFSIDVQSLKNMGAKSSKEQKDILADIRKRNHPRTVNTW